MASNLSELPCLVLLEIASHLNIREKNRLKLVCKRLKTFVESYVQERLCIEIERCANPNLRWPSGEKVKQGDIIRGRARLFSGFSYRFNLRHEFSRKIKHLYLKDVYEQRLRTSDSTFFEDLNGLKNLEVLVIENCRPPTVTLVIDLPLLKTFCVKGLFFEQFVLNTPSLREFYQLLSKPKHPNWKEKFHFEHPDSLKMVQCEKFSDEIEFANLEVLTCSKLGKKFDICKFPKLRLLEVYPPSLRKKGISASSFYRKLVSQTRLLADNPSLEIRIFGFKEELFRRSEIQYQIHQFYDPYDLFPSPFIFDDEYAQMVAKNYAYLASPMPFRIKVHFSSFAKFFNQVPNDFFFKFSFVLDVYVDQLTDFQLLIPLLRAANCLEALDVGQMISLPPLVTDQLPTVNSISILRFCAPPASLDFVVRMKHLRSLVFAAIGCTVWKAAMGSIPDFVGTIFKSLNVLDCFRLKDPLESSKCYICISRLHSGFVFESYVDHKFCCTDSEIKSVDLLNLDQLVNFARINAAILESFIQCSPSTLPCHSVKTLDFAPPPKKPAWN